MSTERTIYHQYRTFDHLYMVESKKGGTKYVVKVFDVFQRTVLNKVFSGSCKVLGARFSIGKESTLQFLREILPQEYLPKVERETTLEECCDDIHRMINQYKSNIVEEPQDLKDWVCPITLEMFLEPVDDEHGHTFEKTAIEEHLKTSNECPLSREPITSASLRPNRRVQEEIKKRRNNSIPNFSLFEKEKASMASRYLKMAQALTEEQEYEEALINYRQAIRFTRSWMDYAKIPLLFEKMQESEKATLAYLYLAKYQLEDGKNNLAIKTLEKCTQNKELNTQITLLISKMYELQGEKEKALQMQILQLAELSKQNPQEAISLCKKVLKQAPEHLEIYPLLANLLEDPKGKAHVLLKGATHAIAAQDHNMAAKLCEDVEGTSFEDTLVFLDILKNKEDPSLIEEKLLSAATIFKEKEMYEELLKISKMLYQNNPTVKYCGNIVLAYRLLGNTQKHYKWMLILLNILIKEKKWWKAEQYAIAFLTVIEEDKKINVYEKLNTIYSNWKGHKLSNLLSSLGKAYLQNNQLEAAEKTYRRAFKQFHTFEHIIGLAETLKERGEIKQSVKAFYEASCVALLKADYQNLSSCIEKIKRIDPNFLELTLNERMHLLSQTHILSFSAKVEGLEKALLESRENERVLLLKQKNMLSLSAKVEGLEKALLKARENERVLHLKQENMLSLSAKVEDLEKALFEARKNERVLHVRQEQMLGLSAKVEVLEEALSKTRENNLRCAFGKADWEKYFGEIGEEPPLPANIGEILKSPCPFWKGMLVEETHILVLVPKTVNGVPLTLNLIGELIKNPRSGFPTQLIHFNDVQEKYGEMRMLSSHWVLLTKNIIPKSNCLYSIQSKLIAKYEGYEHPKLLDVTVGFLMYHVKTGEKLYFDGKGTLTRCKEVLRNGYHVAVGGSPPCPISFTNRHFDKFPYGLALYSDGHRPIDLMGAGASRKL